MADGSLDVVTFGCRLNAYESDRIRRRATADGVTDAVVFNTCAVTAEAVRQARQAIRKARRARPDTRLVVTGCAAQIDPTSFAAMPEVDLVLGNAEKSAPGALWRTGLQVGDIFAAAPLTSPPLPANGRKATDEPVRSVPEAAAGASVALSHARGRSELRAVGVRARAYVEVQNGCDHRCTFCVIPFGRGNSRSTPAERVVDEVRELACGGCAEVVLTGVDLTSWGADLAGAPALGDLVARILAEIPELPRLRLSSIDAAEIDPALMACLAREERLCPHLHLSLQSGDDLILKRMKRRHSSADALRLIEAVRAIRPETAFGADFIAGFPTETDAAFENTARFVEAAGLAYLHVFPYSPRPMTPAARMPQVERDVVKHRAARLRAAGEAALARHLDRQVGRRVEALVEEPGRARAADFTEIAVDSRVGPVGGLVPLTLTGHDGRRATGVPA
ncbi:MAG TPA: tRNA (N(6)-L-threonylcarbamoyladenosine(37)-C(2))-methylthiotransferase MtaB [Caulobacteraceae bacterium]|nr:tRNA (N(6)-L-threonylcarbamoyladenosine(37)-C(2))-methylthiotransferase MtaB [Caulobacteraceae bacterium]